MNRPVVAPSSSTNDKRLEAYVTSEEGKIAVEMLTQKAGALPAADFHSGTLATVARMVGMTTFGDVVIAELGRESFASSLDSVREVAAEGVQLILLGRQDDIATYRAAISAGARDYLALPLVENVELPELMPPPQPIAPESPVRNGKVIAVCGVSGGVGASMLSANLAVALSLEADSQGADIRLADVALVDADLGFGSLAIDLDIEPTQGLIDALAAPERIDRTFLNATMAEPLPGLRVYSAEASDTRDIFRFEQGLPDLVRHLKRECGTTVVDLPRSLMMQASPLVDIIDEVILVMSPGFSSVRACGRLTDRLTHRKMPLRLLTVLSRTRRDAGLKASEIASALNRTVTLELPQCATDLSRASIKGQPLQKLAGRSAYARAVSKLAKIVTETAQPAEPTRLGFFRRKEG